MHNKKKNSLKKLIFKNKFVCNGNKISGKCINLIEYSLLQKDNKIMNSVKMVNLKVYSLFLIAINVIIHYQRQQGCFVTGATKHLINLRTTSCGLVTLDVNIIILTMLIFVLFVTLALIWKNKVKVVYLKENMNVMSALNVYFINEKLIIEP